ncbi:hypothetical protein SAMN06295974_3724 [Plantibacter flavus]|uniref:Uncharacterized protein n=2 Tax=Plantibacter flavus TaxID=150123 RepID=A0A3N2BLP8_9MICO|nr:hypothetical protein EDD42_4081 [Plantibacter flavus]SMG48391.1 hypothetical protein SAMN06295974_3724 [Plantibacter flavus]
MSDRISGDTPGRVRKAVRMHPDTFQRVTYWASKRELSENEYLVEAIEEKIARENGDYDLPTLEIARLNQLVDELGALSRNTANLERVVTGGFDSLLGLTRGDSYLLDAEAGDLDVPDTAAAVVGS